MPYRVEEASTGRAGCKNKECQDNKVKISKGELRLGSWIDTEQIQGWAWKHWGCVTPKQISSLQDSSIGEEEDWSLIDGYDELSDENQQKIREAIEQGHVADSDWRGDVEMNRPGKVGFRVRAKKKDDSKAQTSKEDDKPAKKGGKKGGRKTDEEKETPASKKSKEGEPKKRKRTAAQVNGGDKEEATSNRQKAGRKTGKATKTSAAAATDVNGKDKESQKASRARRAADRAARRES